MSDDIQQELIGREIAGKFKIQRCIGIGGSGSVFAAEQTTLGRTVAVKVLNPSLASTPRTIKRFHDEALAASRLNHPNTVSVIDYGQTQDGLLYLVMEFVAGKTLTQLIEQEFPVPLARILDMLSQVLLGLEEAHANGIVHADLKGDNIIVDRRRGGWDLVKVVDFGIARIVGENDEPGTKKTICGTPEYMAPELVRGKPPNVATDLYALGIILFELLVGKTPFVGGTTIDVLRKQVRTAAPKVTEANPGLRIPAKLEEIITRTLDKEPSHRPRSSSRMRDLLLSIKNEVSAPSESKILCRGCGIYVDESFRFCSECGTPTATKDSQRQARVSRDKPSLSTTSIEMQPGDVPDFAGIWPLPFVGRERALTRLTSLLSEASAAEDAPRQLLISGERGVGRTRLLSASYGAADGSARVYQCSPDPTRLLRPGYPLRALMASVLDIPAMSTAQDIASRLQRLGLAEEYHRGVMDSFGLVEPLYFISAAGRRAELISACCTVLKDFAMRGNHVFVFEDAHLFDDLSCEFIEALAADGEIPIVVTVDSDWQVPDKLAALDALTLSPLSVADYLVLAEHMAQNGVDYLADAEKLFELTEGNPKALHHLIRFSNEGGDIEHAPSKLPDLISARIAMLPHDALITVQLAAMLGHEQQTDDLMTCAAEIGIEDAIDPALDLLAARDFIYEHGDIIGFSDPLVREIIVDATPADVRRMLHATVAGVLQVRTTDPALLGHHYYHGGIDKLASRTLAEASTSAVASGHVDHAIELDKMSLDASRRRILSGDIADDAEMNFLQSTVRLAESLRIRGQTKLALGLVMEAEAYAAEFPILRAMLLFCHGNILMSEDKLERGIYKLEQAALMAGQFGSQVGLIDIYVALSTVLMKEGRLEESEKHLRDGLQVIKMMPLLGPDDLLHEWRVHMLVAKMHSLQGNHRQARVIIAEAIEKHAPESAATAGMLFRAAFEMATKPEIREQLEKALFDLLLTFGDRRKHATILKDVKESEAASNISPETLREAFTLGMGTRWGHTSD